MICPTCFGSGTDGCPARCDCAYLWGHRHGYGSDERHNPGAMMDAIGWFIATAHSVLGHDHTASLIGSLPGDRTDCLLCKYERERTEASRQAVIHALAPSVTDRENDDTQ